MKTAMILAAGRGDRLRPITDKVTKAMCLVHNRPLIEHHVVNLANHGFERIIINHAYLGGQIRRHLGTGARWGVELYYSPEPPGGLETGGGIYNALPLLGQDPFVTINADVFTDYHFESIILPQSAWAHLILVPNPDHNHNGDFGLAQNSLLSNQNKQYTFAGIACYRPEVFQSFTLGRYSVTPLLQNLAQKDLATGSLYEGKWIDIGSLQRLQLANTLTG